MEITPEAAPAPPFQTSDPQHESGCAIVRSSLTIAELQTLAEPIDRWYGMLSEASVQPTPAQLQRLVPSGERYVPTASSVTIGAIFPREIAQALVERIIRGPVGAWIVQHLCAPVVCDLDQSWVRRQYAPGRYPRFHAPHGWHQDGALGFDFAAHGDGRHPADAILRMVTCWVALTACGQDAPGLELVPRAFETLLPPTQLSPDSVSSRFAPGQFWRPVLNAGDALLFRGDILHRTHVIPDMTRDRTSIELRFFPAEPLPARLCNDRFLRVTCGGRQG